MIGVFLFGIAGIVALASGATALGAALLVAAVAAAAATFWFLRPAEISQLTASAPAASARTQEQQEQREAAVARRIAEAEAALAAAVADRGVTLAEDETADSAVERYRAECTTRSATDEKAQQSPRLELALGLRRQAEADAERRAAAIAALRAAAVETRLDETTEPDPIADSLRGWQTNRQDQLQRHDIDQSEWAELQQLLDDRTIEELAQHALDARATATKAAEGLADEEIAAMSLEMTERELPNLRREHQGLVEQAARIIQKAETDGATSTPVADAEAEHDEATSELDRVIALDATLKKTIAFLTEAQKRVYASIAPALTATLEAWLPRVTVYPGPAGAMARYTQLYIDPQTLEVRVREHSSADWHKADNLSTGTREQIYLLLRVALAQHLVKEGEVVPLLLDEVTAQCDSTRRDALLNLLLELSAESQLILFTHDDAVLAWAEAHLDADAVSKLAPVGTASAR